jgi:hypothetical protein
VHTYADCGEDILKLVDKCNEARIVHVDPENVSVLTIVFYSAMFAYALGFVCAMAGDDQKR